MRFFLFLLFLPAVFAGFCDDLTLEISACRITENHVSVDLAPADVAKDFILVFQDGGQEVLFQEARGIRNRAFDGVIWESHEDFQRFIWSTLIMPSSVKVFHKDCIASDYRFMIDVCKNVSIVLHAQMMYVPKGRVLLSTSQIVARHEVIALIIRSAQKKNAISLQKVVFVLLCNVSKGSA